MPSKNLAVRLEVVIYPLYYERILCKLCKAGRNLERFMFKNIYIYIYIYIYWIWKISDSTECKFLLWSFKSVAYNRYIVHLSISLRLSFQDILWFDNSISNACFSRRKVSVWIYWTYNRICALDINAYNDQVCTVVEVAVLISAVGLMQSTQTI